MFALAIFGIIFAAYLFTALVTVIAYNSLPMSRTPQWLDTLYEIVTFGRG